MILDKEKLKTLAAQLVAGHAGGEFDPVPAIPVAVVDVLALLSEIERLELIGRISCNFDGYKAVLDELDQLKAENEGLRQDAERYRYIRQGKQVDEGLCIDLWDADGTGQLLALEAADQAIDAAKKGERHYVH